MEARPELPERRGIHHVVVMLVGEQHIIHPDATLGDPVGDAFRRVDEEIPIGGFDKIAIGLDKAAGVEGDFHGRRKAARGGWTR